MNKIIKILIFLCAFYMVAQVIRTWGFWKIDNQDNIQYVYEEEIKDVYEQNLLLFEDENNVKNLNISLDINEAIEESTNELISKFWTEQELEYLACVIYQEAGADYISDETRLMVGSVVMNRVEHELYPDTIYEVLTQKGQYGRFYWTGIIWPERAKSKVEAHAAQRAYDIAERVLNGERLLDGDYVFQAEFKQSSDYIYQDGLYFCK